MERKLFYIIVGVLSGLLLGWLIFNTTGHADGNGLSNHENLEVGGDMWTCSMHPHIMQPEPGDCPICGMDLIPAESDGEGLASNQIKMTENAMALANINTTVIGEGNSGEGQKITLSGQIKVNEEAEAVQSSYFDGRLEKLNISYQGQEVNKGALLATIYAPNLVAAQQELISSLSLKESQPALYKAVRKKLKLWKLTDNQINAIEKNQKVQEFFPVYATVSGTVAEKMVSEGDYVNQGQPLLKLADLNSVWAEFDVYENQIASLKKGQKITMFSNAYPNKEFEATISFIDPILNEQSRTVAIRATIKNSDGILKPGMFIKGEIQNKSQTPSILSVPSAALLWTGERSIVYLKVNPNAPVFEMREVVLGNKVGDYYEVISGLQMGDEVVTNGAFTIDAAAQLQGKRSMMNEDKRLELGAENMVAMKLKFPTKFQKDFMDVLPLYLTVKNALVESNREKVSLESQKLLVQLNAIDTDGLGNMEKEHFSNVVERTNNIASAKDLANQRNHFVILNENIVPVAMNVEVMDIPLFVQKCPMANDNKGAFWLSMEKEIRNPYYGDQMLTCGNVVDSIQ